MIQLSAQQLPSFAEESSTRGLPEQVSMFSDENLTEQERYLKKKDPETFLYMMILRKMRKNPEAKVTERTKQHMVTIAEDPNQIHNATVTKYKTLNYEKFNKTDADADIFKTVGVIKAAEEDEFSKRRAEFNDYCLKLIDAAIKEEPMSKTDAAKSPIHRA